MLSHCKICNFYSVIFSLSFHTVYRVHFTEISRKLCGKFNLECSIRGFYVCCCCCNSGNYRYIGIFNIKIDNSFTCIISHAGNCFSHHGYIMCRAYRAAMNGCCKSRTPCQMSASPDIFQMTEGICCSICSIDHSAINLVCGGIYDAA